MDIYSLRVKPSRIKFAFDRVYILKYENRAVIKRMFQYSLVMPLHEELKAQFLKVSVHEIVDIPHARGWQADRHADPDLLRQITEDGTWIMVVPLLPQWWKAHGRPAYLTARAWYATAMRRGKGAKAPPRPVAFPSMTFLQTPEKAIRPVCAVCPRFILHQAGQCQLGDEICYTSLTLGSSRVDTTEPPSINVKDLPDVELP